MTSAPVRIDVNRRASPSVIIIKLLLKQKLVKLETPSSDFLSNSTPETTLHWFLLFFPNYALGYNDSLNSKYQISRTARGSFQNLEQREKVERVKIYVNKNRISKLTWFLQSTATEIHYHFYYYYASLLLPINHDKSGILTAYS